MPTELRIDFAEQLVVASNLLFKTIFCFGWFGSGKSSTSFYQRVAEQIQGNTEQYLWLLCGTNW